MFVAPRYVSYQQWKVPTSRCGLAVEAHAMRAR
jgi:hypothetical protein